MKQPLDELVTLLGEVATDADFVARAAQLRPRLNGVVRWGDLGDEEQSIVQGFLRVKDSRPEGLYGPLLVRALAAFEQYLRALIVWTVEQHNTRAGKYDDLSRVVANRNITLTGKVLAAPEHPDHVVLDIPALIGNLATCTGSSEGFRLNAQAFVYGLSGFGPKHLDTALEQVDISDCWDGVGKNETLRELLGTKGARQTGSAAKAKLKELSRLRNRLAHGDNGMLQISNASLCEAVDFIKAFSGALAAVVEEKFR